MSFHGTRKNDELAYEYYCLSQQLDFKKLIHLRKMEKEWDSVRDQVMLNGIRKGIATLKEKMNNRANIIKRYQAIRNV